MASSTERSGERSRLPPVEVCRAGRLERPLETDRCQTRTVARRNSEPTLHNINAGEV